MSEELIAMVNKFKSLGLSAVEALAAATAEQERNDRKLEQERNDRKLEQERNDREAALRRAHDLELARISASAQKPASGISSHSLNALMRS